MCASALKQHNEVYLCLCDSEFPRVVLRLPQPVASRGPAQCRAHLPTQMLQRDLTCVPDCAAVFQSCSTSP